MKSTLTIDIKQYPKFSLFKAIGFTFMAFLLLVGKAHGTQLSGSYTINSGGTASATVFKDFASAIIYMTSTSSRPDGGTANSGTVGVSGAVTFNVTAGTTYTLSSALTVPAISGASSSYTVTFKKNGSGANPVIIGYSGSGSYDGIVIFQGANNVTFDGIDIKDPSTNTSLSTQMEWGYALLRTSSVGSQYITIQNCNIQLNRANVNSVGIYGDAYSWSSGSISAVTVSSSSGANSYNGFYGNTISNCYYPIYMRGYQSGTASICDANNDAGSAGGNIISAFGYLGNSGPYSNTFTGAVVNGILFFQQGGTYLIENNSVTLTASDNISVVINGISSVAYGVAVSGANPTIIGNTVNITSTSTASAFTGIANNQGTGSSIEDVENNIVTGINTTATGASNFIGINIQSTIPSGKYIYEGNEIKNCVLSGTGFFHGISTAGLGNPTSPFSFSKNKVHDNKKDNGSGDMYLITHSVGKNVLTMAKNQIYNNVNNSGNIYGIYNTVATSSENINNNQIYNLSTTSSNNVAGIYCNNSTTTRNIFLDSMSNFTSNGGLVYGINCSAGSTVNIYRNKMYFANGAFGAIYYTGINGTSSAPGIISNNFISLGGSGTYAYGIFDNGGSYHSYFNNSIVITNTLTSNAGFFVITTSSSSYVYFINNTVSNTGGGYAINVAGGSGIANMDYNNWYATGNYTGNWGSTQCAKLSDFQKASSFDSHSISVLPAFVSNTDLHLKNRKLYGTGTPLSSVTNDIDGNPRFASPTIGAVEIPPIKSDLSVTAILNPNYGDCGDSFMSISANITNFGTDSQANILVTAFVKGSSGFSATYTNTYKPKLPYDSTAKITITNAINTSKGGTYTFKVYTSLKNDSNHTNDTMVSVATFYSHSPRPSVSSAAICGRGSLRLTATITSKPDSIYWYSYPKGDTLLATGTTYNTPPISKTTTYYAQERVPVKTYGLGPKTTSIGSTGITTASTGIKFNALTIFTIDSATIYPIATGGVIIQLSDSFGNLIKSVNVLVKVTSSGAALRIPVGIIVSQGNGYTLNIYNGTSGLYYNSSGASYPYTVSNVAAIVSPSNGTGSSALYYGLYNLLIRTGNCGSPLVPVTATIASPEAFLKQDNSSTGKLNSGTLADPDKVCAGSTFVYDLITALPSSGFGSTWTIVSKSLKTIKGTVSSDTSSTNPSVIKGPAKFTFSSKTANADSTYIVKILVRTIGKLSCDSTVIRYITVAELPKPKFGFKNACLNNSLLFYDSSTISTGSVTGRSWDFADTKISTLQNPTHAYASAGQYSVTLTSISDFGCQSTVKRTVEQYPLPKPKFGIVPACQGYPTVFTDSSAINTGAVTGWKWNFGDPFSGGSSGNTSALRNPTHVYAKSGPYKVKLITTSSFGCKDSLTKSITKIQPKPFASFSYNTGACVGSVFSFANLSFDSLITGTTYLWEYGDGTTSTGSSGSHVYTKNGTFRMKLTVTSKSGCTDTMVQTISPSSKPNVNFFNSAACTGKTVTFSDSGKNDKASIYTWTYGDGSAQDNYKGIVSTTHVYKKGSYKVKLLIANPAGCADSETKAIVITDNPKAGFTAPDVCAGKTTIFTDVTAPTGTYTYKWDFGDASVANTTQNPAHTYKSSGTYKAHLTVTNGSGCNDTITKPVNVNAPPAVGKWTAKIHNYTVQFAPADSTQKTYKWLFGDGDSSSAKKPGYSYPNTPSRYYVKLFVTNAGGCTGSYSDSVSVGKNGISALTVSSANINVYPNPFQYQTKISYQLANTSRVSISVYDIEGRLIGKLREANLPAGNYTDEFDPGKYGAAGGIYLLRMMINDEVYTARIVNMK